MRSVARGRSCAHGVRRYPPRRCSTGLDRAGASGACARRGRDRAAAGRAASPSLGCTRRGAASLGDRPRRRRDAGRCRRRGRGGGHRLADDRRRAALRPPRWPSGTATSSSTPPAGPGAAATLTSREPVAGRDQRSWCPTPPPRSPPSVPTPASRLGDRVVGITGSVGKTSTKDLTAAALGSPPPGDRQREELQQRARRPAHPPQRPGDHRGGRDRDGRPRRRPHRGAVRGRPARRSPWSPRSSWSTPSSSVTSRPSPGPRASWWRPCPTRAWRCSTGRTRWWRPWPSAPPPTSSSTASTTARCGLGGSALDDELRARFVLESAWGATEVRLGVRGEHHVGNALAAAAVALVHDVPLEEIAAGARGGRAVAVAHGPAGRAGRRPGAQRRLQRQPHLDGGGPAGARRTSTPTRHAAVGADGRAGPGGARGPPAHRRPRRRARGRAGRGRHRRLRRRAGGGDRGRGRARSASWAPATRCW